MSKSGDEAKQELQTEFRHAWKAAGLHLTRRGEGGLAWLRAHLQEPNREHMVFRLANRLFSVWLDVEGVRTPDERFEAFLQHADRMKAIACILPMERRGSEFEPAFGGWGLVGAITTEPIDPVSLVDDSLVEMSDWEVHDLAVNVVKEALARDGATIVSSCSYLDIDPSIWFDRGRGREWIVLRAVRHPLAEAERPASLARTERFCLDGGGALGHFASVGIANADQQFGVRDAPSVPLYRGHRLHPLYEGLSSLRPDAQQKCSVRPLAGASGELTERPSTAKDAETDGNRRSVNAPQSSAAIAYLAGLDVEPAASRFVDLSSHGEHVESNEERLERQYPGVLKTISFYKDATLPACAHCGSADTAIVTVGAIGRSIAVAASTKKMKLLGNGPKPANHWCNTCATFFS